MLKAQRAKEEDMTILVTGATGKTGREVIGALVECGLTIRPFTHHNIQFDGVAETAVGDLTNPADVRRAMRGVSKVYHICPNMHPQEIEIGQSVIAAAQAADVQQFVYHSVLHPQIEAMPHHWRKLRVEEMLFRSGLPFTILQPTAYMQNIDLARVRETAVYTTPYPTTTRISLVDLADVAQVAAKVLTEDGHSNAIYALVGEPNLSQDELAQRMAEAWGIAVQAREQSLAVWKTAVQSANFSAQKINDLQAMFRYYAAYGMVGNTAVLRMLLNERPTNFLEHVYERVSRLS